MSEALKQALELLERAQLNREMANVARRSTAEDERKPKEKGSKK